MSSYKSLREKQKAREKKSYNERLSNFIKKRKRNPASTMRELRRKAAKQMGLKPSQIGLKDKK